MLDDKRLDIKSVAPGAIVVVIPEDTAFGNYALKVEIKYGVDNARQKARLSPISKCSKKNTS